MLSKLHIQNIGIIENIEIDFNDKLNIITGETGAGKTLIIDSINLVTGNRVNRNIIRDGSSSAFVEACFFIDLPDISEDGMLVLSREIYSNGKNICKINGRMATLTQLKEVGDKLIDIHGQHDIMYLLNPNMYIEFLDNYIGLEITNIKKEYIELLKNNKELKSKIVNLYLDPIERQRKLDLLEYQYNEIKNANLKVDEEEELISKKNLMQNYEKIFNSLNESYENIQNSAIHNIDNCISKLSKITDIDIKYKQIYDRLQDISYDLEDISSNIYDNLNMNLFDEDERNLVFDRLDYIFSLKRKYGNNIEDILKYFESLENQINELNDSEEYANKLNKEYIENKEKLYTLALKMHNIRNKKANELQEMINKQLKSLEMPKAKFSINVNFNDDVFEFKSDEEYKFDENGLDRVEFNIVTNVGGKEQMINKIASGGELSRVTLALKTVLADSYKIPTIIFDEIDTGLSGDASIAVGQKMNVISQKHQIITITHNANIAALGDLNIFVKKEIEENLTKTKIKILNYEEKINEIARILSGNNITDIAREHAIELINNKE